MRTLEDHQGFRHWKRLAGTWMIQATHPELPGDEITGQATFEWLADQQALIRRSHYDHPRIPDSVAITAIVDGEPAMHYFDVRGTHRVFKAELTPAAWRFRNETPGFSQRFTGIFGTDGDTITGHGELCRDGERA